jgi:hypothetical protein
VQQASGKAGTSQGLAALFAKQQQQMQQVSLTWPAETLTGQAVGVDAREQAEASYMCINCLNSGLHTCW